jgi:hypothetical protein
MCGAPEPFGFFCGVFQRSFTEDGPDTNISCFADEAGCQAELKNFH